MKVLLAVLVALVAMNSFVNATTIKTATAFGSRASLSVKEGLQCDAVGALACGQHVMGYNATGWSRLHVNGSETANYLDAAYGAGYVEGMLTQHEIYMAFTNMWHQFFGPNPNVPEAVKEFVTQNYAWVQQTIDERASTSTYWAQVATIMAQYDGLMAGYNSVAPASEQLTTFQFQCLQLDGDLETLTQIYGTGEPPAEVALRGSAQNEHTLMQRFSHCSSCVRVTNTDVFMAHDTWDGFVAMLRMFKHYRLRIPDASGTVITSTVSLSGTPGYLSSVDDLYLTSNGIFVSETTNGVMNNTILKNLTPKGVVFSWLRCMVATFTATNGTEWGTAFSKYNSGTYNNQWIIVTLDKYTAGTASTPAVLDDGLLFILEQMPNMIVSGDQTETLRTEGYWGSYNIPFYKQIYDYAGFQEYFEKYGNAYSHEHCPRANIFRRDAPKVQTLDEFKLLMQHNDWQNDPLQLGSPANGIMSRYDLLPSKPIAFGGIDSKVMDLAMAKSGTIDAMNGPTHVQQIPFKWSSEWDGEWHLGQPVEFDYSYQTMTNAFVAEE